MAESNYNWLIPGQNPIWSKNKNNFSSNNTKYIEIIVFFVVYCR